MLIDSMKSARVLNGKSVWMKTGYTVVYYPYRTGRIVFPQNRQAGCRLRRSCR